MAEAICSRGDILLCEDWEWSTNPDFVAVSADWTGHGWDQGQSDLNAYPGDNVFGLNTMPSGTPFSGNNCLTITISPSPADGSLFPMNAITNVTLGNWVHARQYVKFSPGYKFMGYQSGNEQKCAYFRSDSGGVLIWRFELQTTATDSTGNFGKWQLDPSPPHVISYNTNQPGNFTVNAGVWYCVEFAVKLPTSSADNDGALRLWVDGVLATVKDNIVITGGATTPINNYWITAYYGGNPGDTHPLQYVWYDNIVVSTSYIGPLDAPASSSPLVGILQG